jgi:hypothetical protein
MVAGLWRVVGSCLFGLDLPTSKADRQSFDGPPLYFLAYCTHTHTHTPKHSHTGANTHSGQVDKPEQIGILRQIITLRHMGRKMIYGR